VLRELLEVDVPLDEVLAVAEEPEVLVLAFPEEELRVAAVLVLVVFPVLFTEPDVERVLLEFVPVYPERLEPLE